MIARIFLNGKPVGTFNLGNKGHIVSSGMSEDLLAMALLHNGLGFVNPHNARFPGALQAISGVRTVIPGLGVVEIRVQN